MSAWAERWLAAVIKPPLEDGKGFTRACSFNWKHNEAAPNVVTAGDVLFVPTEMVHATSGRRVISRDQV